MDKAEQEELCKRELRSLTGQLAGDAGLVDVVNYLNGLTQDDANLAASLMQEVNPLVLTQLQRVQTLAGSGNNTYKFEALMKILYPRALAVLAAQRQRIEVAQQGLVKAVASKRRYGQGQWDTKP